MNILSAQKLALLNKIQLVNNKFGWNSLEMLDMTEERFRHIITIYDTFEWYGMLNLFKLLRVLKHAT